MIDRWKEKIQFKWNQRKMYDNDVRQICKCLKRLLLFLKTFKKLKVTLKIKFNLFLKNICTFCILILITAVKLF